MFCESRIERGVSPWLRRSVLERAGDGGEEVGCLVKAAFCALGHEAWRGRGGVLQDGGKWEFAGPCHGGSSEGLCSLVGCL